MSAPDPSEGTAAFGLSAMLKEQMSLMAELHRRQRTNILSSYQPYAKQREFHAAGATFRERLFMARETSSARRLRARRRRPCI
ncbi:hypothetical protein ACVI1N_004232 [Sinorhizobium medicae]